MYCSKCGKKISDDARFCSSCGSNISASIENVPKADENWFNQNKKEIITAIILFILGLTLKIIARVGRGG